MREWMRNFRGDADLQSDEARQLIGYTQGQSQVHQQLFRLWQVRLMRRGVVQGFEQPPIRGLELGQHDSN